MWGTSRPEADIAVLAEEAITLARQLGDITAEYFAIGCHAAVIIDPFAAEAMLQRAMTLPSATIPAVYRASLTASLVNNLLRRRDQVAAAALLNSVLAAGSKRFGLFESNLLYQAGRLALDQGDTDKAREFSFRPKIPLALLRLRAGLSHLRSAELARRAFSPCRTLLQQGIEIEQVVSPARWTDD
jgi:hypothetical protein